MAKVLYSVTMSLDGFIAGPGGDMQWLAPFVGEDGEANEVADGLVDQVGALLVGRRTWDGDDPNRGTDAEGAMNGQWHGPQVVLTHRPPSEPIDGVTFLADPAEAVAAAKAAAGDRDVNVLGAAAARACLDIGELDEVLVFVVPVLLGDGTRLFERPGGDEVRLEPISVGGGLASPSLWYRVVR